MIPQYDIVKSIYICTYSLVKYPRITSLCDRFSARACSESHPSVVNVLISFKHALLINISHVLLFIVIF